MKTYNVTITETTVHTVQVEATTEHEAQEIAEEMHCQGTPVIPTLKSETLTSVSSTTHPVNLIAKVSTTEQSFKPVTITLETQEEVDEMLAIMRHRSICPDESPLDSIYYLLAPLADETESDRYYHALCHRLEARYAK